MTVCLRNGLPRLREQTKTEVPKLYDKGTKKHDFKAIPIPPRLGVFGPSAETILRPATQIWEKSGVSFHKTEGFVQKVDVFIKTDGGKFFDHLK